MKKYQVIGGQYRQVWYGESDSILQAKRIATRHEEYWDNWQGWHKPRIYEADAVDEKTGYIKPGYYPIFVWSERSHKWIEQRTETV